MRYLVYIVLVVMTGLMGEGCRKPYDLPIVIGAQSSLVVEGTVVAGAGYSTKIRLSQLGTVEQSNTPIPVSRAQVRVVSGNGNSWLLPEKEFGVYEAYLDLPVNLTYQLTIQTTNGKLYESPLQAVVQTPEIDSVTWSYDQVNLEIFAHTHDTKNSTRYYRWEYDETWESRAWYETYFDFQNGSIITRPTGDQIFSCWKQDVSKGVIIGNSLSLSEDVISYQPVALIPRPSEKAYVRYSLLLRQIGLTKEAYNFWNLLKKNTELTGTLFDPQPSVLPTNVRCLNDTASKVIGFVSVATVSEKRMFVRNSQLPLWPYRNENLGCTATELSKYSAEQFLANHPDFLPAYYVTAGGNYGVAERKCVDCRLQGGTNRKPDYW
jgi:hypothetical protein